LGLSVIVTPTTLMEAALFGCFAPGPVQKKRKKEEGISYYSLCPFL
jgi:hypothetical protein